MVQDILTRMVAVAGVQTDNSLATAIGVASEVIAHWKCSESIPLEVIVDFAINNNVSLDFLILGNEQDQRPLSTEEALRGFVLLSADTISKFGAAYKAASEDMKRHLARFTVSSEAIAQARKEFLGIK